MPSQVADVDTLEVELAKGLGHELGAWGFGTWHDNGEYSDADPCPIVLAEAVSIPDERILLTVSPLTVIRGRIVVVPVSLQYRGQVDADPLDGLRFTGSLYRRLHRLSHYTFGTVRVGTVLHQSSGTLGPDTRRRPSASANYLFRAFQRSVND